MNKNLPISLAKTFYGNTKEIGKFCLIEFKIQKNIHGLRNILLNLKYFKQKNLKNSALF